ncbi:putative transcriptional regulator [Methylobacterium sp. PvP062]|uniref:Transcriptional regulator, MucR family n=2 Tax=Methylobacterium radiotolerans TaxID=31998 RepID=B1M3F0_METRJ|nr:MULTISPECIES: MucR family transcriptional regulator [Methylobacterium]MCX7330835.1 MucR family transcriptional regulator [Hyphomicrobiales bacterium]ACB26290.1 transcriptional regulator, MucR family [Methylobacterium radiotolerans JCM 2831]KIU29866.1 MucR family transcriptional regulator [Methylobacterium radiotolerans]MBP2497434.1 putative transcriptional regulator [Methylobacterium sp. PvP105]MBP2502695.1 putative transcriptional regulator [Methylobacterium sp. PvP109]
MSEAAPTSQLDFIERTVDVVAAYVSNNSLPSAELPALIASIHEALNTIGAGPAAPATESVERPTPAQIRKSIRPDGLVSFIDGKSYKTLKRHLTKHGLDPQTYRERYGLPADYPTTSANYSAQRSALAKSLGLGQPGRSPSSDKPAAPAEEAPAAPASGRRKAATAATKARASRKVEAA